ncbi:MAG: hypothetical protein A2162_03465 [Deltaproteobacteria bacterium RBG_13_52_11b]|nr:MAG: hypothetical protein A2162_03465 [Deltaproteobacteria bacterium RBG_13_52_11b]
MSKEPWTPWHKVVALRDDLKSGELALSMFAADLYDVMMGRAKAVYQEPTEFFVLTYPTFNLRELVKDILLRLAGKNEKAVRQLEITYGGGKTHTLITLFHLVRDPKNLPDLPAVKEFVEHAGINPPETRVAALSFDKLDVEKGMQVKDPEGHLRWLKQPWSVLAWQIAGTDGLQLLHPDNKDAERESAPAENLMVELLAIPEKAGLATLILIDEVLMFAREKVGLDPAWRGRLQNFFQYTTQAATKVDRCAMVASLLATDPAKSDKLGKEITQELYAIFRREREEGVQPVVKEDVAEVLRRRLFKHESVKDPGIFTSHVVAALKGIANLDENTRKAGKQAEERFLRSFPFHPDLTDLFYSKWTNLEGFQRTRGVLRTFALALREAEKWDKSPLIAANVFLTGLEKEGVSEALRELTSIAATEEYEGKRHEWTGILDGELSKARSVQVEFPGLKFREIEQAVAATFLHSQPIGQKALTSELMILLSQTRPDKIELEKALRKWADISWFLDETAINEMKKESGDQLPKSWRLGTKPNLRQMHHVGRGRASPDLVETMLLDSISKNKSLTAGASAAGARVHNLPQRPRDIDDDGEFHFAILGPSAASDPGKPSPEARRFIDETTAKDRPRVFRNSIVLALPSKEGLEIASDRIRDYLGWEEVRSELKSQELDPIRSAILTSYLDESKKAIPEAIKQAYCIVVTVSDKNEVQAFRITAGDNPLFQTIKSDTRSRIQETAVTAEALLPGGPYELWKEGESSRRVKDLVGAFSQFTHLPKMLNRKAILDTLLEGCVQGTFVLRLTRPDRSVRTFWREWPDENALKDPGLEVVLPEVSELFSLKYELLLPGKLPGLWKDGELRYSDIIDYFSGGHVVKLPKEGYEEPVAIPKVDRKVLSETVNEAVRAGKLWLTSGPASLLGEDIPAGILTEDSVLQPAPEPIPAPELLPEKLKESWSGENTTALAIVTALSKKAGKTLPWVTIHNAIDGALKARFLELAADSSPWPSGFTAAQNVKLRIPREKPITPKPQEPTPGLLIADGYLEPNQIQDLADQIPEITKTAAGQDLKYRIRIELKAKKKDADKVAEKINELLKDVSDDLQLRS